MRQHEDDQEKQVPAPGTALDPTDPPPTTQPPQNPPEGPGGGG